MELLPILYDQNYISTDLLHIDVITQSNVLGANRHAADHYLISITCIPLPIAAVVINEFMNYQAFRLQCHWLSFWNMCFTGMAFISRIFISRIFFLKYCYKNYARRMDGWMDSSLVRALFD